MKALVTMLLVLAVASPARAANADPPAQVCLPAVAHQKILADLLELRGDPDKPESTGLRGRVLKLDVLAVKQTAQIVDLQLAKGLAVSAKEVAESAIEAAVRGKRAAEKERDAWHRAPTLWLAIGVVGALVIAVTVDKIQEN